MCPQMLFRIANCSKVCHSIVTSIIREKGINCGVSVRLCGFEAERIKVETWRNIQFWGIGFATDKLKPS